jgi:hypothetical protein
VLAGLIRHIPAPLVKTGIAPCQEQQREKADEHKQYDLLPFPHHQFSLSFAYGFPLLTLLNVLEALQKIE